MSILKFVNKYYVFITLSLKLLFNSTPSSSKGTQFRHYLFYEHYIRSYVSFLFVRRLPWQHCKSLNNSLQPTQSWWRHQMETFSAVTWMYDVFFDLYLNKRLRKQSEVGDLRRHRAHWDVIVITLSWFSMCFLLFPISNRFFQWCERYSRLLNLESWTQWTTKYLSIIKRVK